MRPDGGRGFAAGKRPPPHLIGSTVAGRHSASIRSSKVPRFGAGRCVMRSLVYSEWRSESSTPRSGPPRSAVGQYASDRATSGFLPLWHRCRVTLLEQGQGSIPHVPYQSASGLGAAEPHRLPRPRLHPLDVTRLGGLAPAWQPSVLFEPDTAPGAAPHRRSLLARNRSRRFARHGR